MTAPQMAWSQLQEGVWKAHHLTAGDYWIHRINYPWAMGRSPRSEYEVRHNAPYHGLDEHGYYIGRGHRLDEAERFAERHAHVWDMPNKSVPEDYPALKLKRFFWPISEGITRGALVVVEKKGRLVAQVIGMSRGGDSPAPDYPFVPAVYAQVKVPEKP